MTNLYSSNLRSKLLWHPESQMRMISTYPAKTACIQSRFYVSFHPKAYLGKKKKKREKKVTYNEHNPIGMYILVCSIWIAGCQLEACCKTITKDNLL